MNNLDTLLSTGGLSKNLGPQIAFLLEIDKLKTVLRRNYLADGSRRENTAEHSWHLVLFALTLFEHRRDPDLDLGRILKMCALHDLVEVYAGDTFFWDEQGNADKYQRESAAARKLFGLLPQQQGEEFRRLWEEFEASDTPDSRFANAVDRLAPVLLNSVNGAESWRVHGIRASQLRDKMAVIGEASPSLGELLEQLIQEGVRRGDLKD